MKINFHILIIEPSIVIREGLSVLLKSTSEKTEFAIIESLNDSLNLYKDIRFNVVLVNPIIFNNLNKEINLFFSHFDNANLIGLISTYYSRSICSRFVDCIYLTDNKEAILNTVAKYLAIKNKSNNTIDNTLSRREEDVLKLLVKGQQNKEIAEELFISIHTVITHRKNISNKLGVKSTAAMAIYAVANNIIDLNESLKTIK